MATKQEIITAIQDADAQVMNTISGLSDADGQTRVGDGGWTIKESLSHMAGRKPIYERIMAVAQGERTELGGNPDPDIRNDAFVTARRDKPLADILAEFLAVHEWVIAQVPTLPDEGLTKQITLRERQIEIGDMLKLAAGTHSVNHLKEMQDALAKA